MERRRQGREKHLPGFRRLTEAGVEGKEVRERGKGIKHRVGRQGKGRGEGVGKVQRKGKAGKREEIKK